MNWLDIVVIAIIAIFAIVGLFRGFFNGIISLCSIFISLLISIKAANWFAGLIRSLVDIDGWFDTLLSGTFGVEESMVIFGTSYPREKIAAFLTVVLSALILFIFIRCIIRLLKNLFTSLTDKSKTLSGLNKILGLVLGALKGGVLVVVALAVCSIITSLGIPGITDTINNAIAETKVTSFAYEIVDDFVEGKINDKSFDEIIKGIFDEDKAEEQDNNTYIYVSYPNNAEYWTYHVDDDIDYSAIKVIYIAGEGATPRIESVTASNFSSPITTNEAKDLTSVTLTLYGKTVEFKYIVV